MTFRKRSLEFNLLTLGLGVVLIPLVSLLIISKGQEGQVKEHVRTAMVKQARREMSNQVRSIIQIVDVSNDLLHNSLEVALTLGEQAIELEGGIEFSGTASNAQVEWLAVNQYTGEETPLRLPQVSFGSGASIQPVSSFQESVPIVDNITGLTGDTATIFQRMNEAGDLLRIATSVSKGDQRAVGTYIPAINPDGSENPVVKEVLAGRTYKGRAYVVDQYYATVYKPLYKSDGEVGGVLYVGLPERIATDKILQGISEIKIGETGYAFILNAKGDDAGRTVLSAENAYDEMNVIDFKDSDGRLFIREMVENSLKLEPGQVASIEYIWKHEWEDEPQLKLVEYAYYADWDWLVGVGSYENEFYSSINEVQATFDRFSIFHLIGVAVFALISLIVFTIFTRNLTGSIEKIIDRLAKGSDKTASFSVNLSSASRSVAEGAVEQAESVEKSMTTVDSLAELTDKISTIAHGTWDETVQADAKAKKGIEAMQELQHVVVSSGHSIRSMNDVINDISQSSHSVSKIVSTIDEIAFQTNILALNASVEAARAGEAGAGFAVVAEEVRNLAGRTAVAARETTQLIQKSVATSKSGVEASGEVSSYLNKLEERASTANEILLSLAKSVANVNDAMATIEANSQGQHLGISGVKGAVNQISNVTTANAEAANESAARATELRNQAAILQDVVRDLSEVVHGSKWRKIPSEPKKPGIHPATKTISTGSEDSPNDARTIASEHRDMGAHLFQS